MFKFNKTVIAAAKAQAAAAQGATTRMGQLLLDAFVAKVKAATPLERKAAWKDQGAADAFKAAFAECGVAESSANMYTSSAKIAYVNGLMFAPSLVKTTNIDGTAKDASATKKDKGAKTSGKVTVTDKPALIATLEKALEQARALKLFSVSGEIKETLEGLGWEEPDTAAM